MSWKKHKRAIKHAKAAMHAYQLLKPFDLNADFCGQGELLDYIIRHAQAVGHARYQKSLKDWAWNVSMAKKWVPYGKDETDSAVAVKRVYSWFIERYPNGMTREDLNAFLNKYGK